MRWTADGVYVGPVFGVPLLIHNSVAVAAPLIALFAIGAGNTRDLMINLIVFPLLVVSVIAHELAHARAASAFGVPVRHIALTWFGGFAEFWLKPTSRWREAAIAFSGPAANLLLAALTFGLLAFLYAPPPWQLVNDGGIEWYWLNPQYRVPTLQEIVTRLAWFNLALGLLNLLPGLPLDGGHILRAGLGARMSRGRASWIAAWSGVVIGAVMVGYAIWVESVWPLIIGAFIAASAWLERRRIRYE